MVLTLAEPGGGSEWLGGGDDLDLEVDVDLVAHEGAVEAKWCIERDAEVAAVDLAAGTEAGAGGVVSVDSYAVELEIELDLLGNFTNGEVADECVAGDR